MVNLRARLDSPRSATRKRTQLTCVLIIIPLTIAMMITPAAAATKNVKTSTAAGYTIDLSSTGNVVDDVLGFWTVPTVPASSGQSVVLESVVITSSDGSAIEIGTSQFSSNGAVSYRAWYQASPEAGGPVHIKELDGKVEPGRTVGAEVHFAGGNNWGLAIVSGTSGTFPDRYTTSVVHTGGRSMAGWIVQPEPDTPLANFGTIPFDRTNATVNGIRSPLHQLDNNRVRLYDTTLVCNLADTSDIDTSAPADIFYVTFVQSAGPCNPPPPPPPPLLGNFAILLATGGFLIGGVVVAVLAFAVVSARKKSASIQMMAQSQLQYVAGPPATPLRSFCSKCGGRLKPEARFCDNCGQAVL